MSEKLKPVSSDVIRIDFNSFSEPEKQLFRKIWEIEQKYGSSPPADVIEANKEFIFKAREVISRRVLELFMFVMSEVLGSDEIEVWYSKLHFYNFFEDLKDCLENVRKWSEKDREEFLGHRKVETTLLYIQLAEVIFKEISDEFTVRVANKSEDIQALLEIGFEYVCEKDGLLYFRKRK